MEEKYGKQITKIHLYKYIFLIYYIKTSKTYINCILNIYYRFKQNISADDLVSFDFESDVPHRITHYTVMAGHSEPNIYVHCCKSIKAEFNLLT